jgi:hypothetical protein
MLGSCPDLAFLSLTRGIKLAGIFDSIKPKSPYKKMAKSNIATSERLLKDSMILGRRRSALDARSEITKKKENE